ncbi:3-isopropylmalate dehydratase large subunit, partial [Thermoplasma sp.]|uniref:3-isopropylmalate dehydratase large subunit n=1 Tax=Thermoplasma sp. TaxID=1973142 RepID=UPI001289B814
PKTMAEKILSRASGRSSMAGDYVWAVPDIVYLNDLMGPVTLSVIRKIGVTKIDYRGKLIFIADHIYPPKDVPSANNINIIRQYAEENGFTFIQGGEGIEHTVLIEKRLVGPGDLAVGTDSHTVTLGAVGCMGVGMGITDVSAIMALGKNWFLVPESILIDLKGRLRRYVSGKDIILSVLKILKEDGANYMSMEFHGEALRYLSIDQRMAIANMTVEAGAKAGMIEPDGLVGKFFDIDDEDLKNVRSDEGAHFDQRLDIDLDSLGPQIAVPYSPANVHNVREYVGTRVDQVYIGNCANGTITDLREAAEILRNRTVAKGVKLIIVPGSRDIYRQAIKEGLIDIFLDAGAVISPPNCGACAGLHMGVLGDGETAISNTNRNFRGRMGSSESKVYLANTYVAAAAAIEGMIIDPEASL